MALPVYLGEGTSRSDGKGQLVLPANHNRPRDRGGEWLEGNWYGCLPAWGLVAEGPIWPEVQGRAPVISSLG